MLRRLIDWTATDWALKLTALALAFLLWVTVRADAPGQWQWEVPVRVVNNAADWVVADTPAPAHVMVTFRGPYRELLRASSDLPYVIVPIQQVNDSTEVHVLRTNWVQMPPGTENTTVAQFNPSTVRISFDHVTTRLLPLAVQARGEPAPGTELFAPIDLEPAVVRASGAARTLARIDSLRLPVIDLTGRSTFDTLEVTIDTTGTGLVISPRTVRVFLPIRPIIADTGALPLVPESRVRPPRD